MYQLASVPIVVKIARPTIGHVRQVVQLVRWLEQCDVPTVSLWNSIDQPLQVAGCAVTFWRYLPPTSPISAGDSAEPLSALHGIGAPPITVPMYAPLNAIRRSIDASRLLTIEDQKLLKDRCEALSSEADEVQYELPPGVIHGDPQHGNALWDVDFDRPVLCDWESATIGPPEWDLITVEVHCRRFNHPPQEYRDFHRRYGVDIRDWTSYTWLRDVRELRMISTNARKSLPGTAQAAEVLRRVAALRAQTSVRWHIL